MSNRVLMGPLPGGGIGLRVSRPGSDVLSASLAENQVSFDSRWTNSAKVYTTGSVSVPSNTTPFTYITAYFGKTFASIPPVIAFEESGGVWKPLTQHIITDAGAWVDDLDYLTTRVFTDRIVFYRRYSESFTAHYIVMDGV